MTLASRNTDEVSTMEFLNTVIRNGYYCDASKIMPEIHRGLLRHENPAYELCLAI
jgi:hypothetical protein